MECGPLGRLPWTLNRPATDRNVGVVVAASDSDAEAAQRAALHSSLY